LRNIKKIKTFNYNHYFDQIIDNEHAHKLGIVIYDEDAYANISTEQIALSRDSVFKGGDTASLIDEL